MYALPPMPAGAIKFDHGGHIAGAILTCGLWLPVYLILYFSAKSAAETRWARLVQTYGAEVADYIARKQIFQGMTEAAMMEAYGRPFDIASRVMRAKTRYTYKYLPGPRGGARLTVTVEEGIVVGWETK